MVVNTCGKHSAHLGCHKTMCDALALKVFIEGDDVEAYFLGDDMGGGSAGDGGIHVHHVGIETITGVGSHFVRGMEVVVALIPMAECHDVAMLYLAAFWSAGGAGGVEQDEEGGRERGEGEP